MTTSILPPARRHPHAVERAKPALLDEHAEAEPDQFALPAGARSAPHEVVIAQVVEQPVEQPGIVAGIVDDLGAERVDRAANGICRPGSGCSAGPRRVAASR